MSIKNISSEEAWKYFNQHNDAVIVDVRTDAEWQHIGKPKLDNEIQHRLIFLSWRILPQMVLNHNFIEHLEKQITNKNTPIFFLCKAGGRSFEAAGYASQFGFTECYNVADGFEGNHLGLGWKANNLPWDFLKNVS